MIFSVRILHTNYRFTASAQESVLDAALRQNIPLPWGCGGGVCGICMGQVVSGEMVYPQGSPLALFEEDAAAGKGLVCTGHARSDLLLDIPEMR